MYFYRIGCDFLSSYWIDSINNFPNFNIIDSDCKCDVCIIGGGITGLTCGYYLSKIGLKVIIVEKENISKKTSGNTTGKITFNHNLIYDYLINSYDEKYAKAYLEANKNAIQNIKKIIDNEKINCDFEYQPNYIYTTKQEELPKIKAEINALNNLGEKAEFITKSPLPFKIAGGILTQSQAQFHPTKYMLGLANSILKNSSIIFCNSLATDISKEKNEYITLVNNYKIKSSNVIISTHYPFIKIPRFLFYQNVSINILCFRYRYSFRNF